MARFDSPSTRKLSSYNLIKLLKDFNDEHTNLVNQASMLLCNYGDIEQGDDAQNRNKLLGCCEQITGAIAEMKSLDSRYRLKDSKISGWLESTWVDLLSYVPPLIDNITTVDGREIDSMQKEIRTPSYILLQYDPSRLRGNRLNSDMWEFPYDDWCVNQRTIKESTPIYDDVVSNVHEYKSWTGKLTGIGKDYKRAVVDIEEKEYESDPNPILPEPKDFLNLLGHDAQKELDVFGAIETMKSMKKRREAVEAAGESFKDKEYYEKLYVVPNELDNNAKEFVLHDDKMSYEYCKNIYDDIANSLFFEFTDGSYMMMSVDNKEIVPVNPDLKSKYVSPAANAIPLVSHYIYNNKNIESYYKDFEYELHLTLTKYEGNYKDGDERVKPTDNISDEGTVKTVGSLKRVLEDSIYNARLHFNSINEAGRCLEHDPERSYDFFYNFITSFAPISIKQANKLIDWTIDTLEPWVNKRIIALKATTSDIDNATILINLHKKRLTKGVGSLLIWYQSITQMDNSYDNYLNTKIILERLCRQMLLVMACDNPDPRIFYHYDNPNYIDLAPTDPLFGKSRFNTGDKVYIMNDLYEQVNYVTSIQFIDIMSTDFADINTEEIEKGNLMDGVSIGKTIKVLRLMLKYPLPYWCKTDNTEDLEDLRVLKIL